MSSSTAFDSLTISVPASSGVGERETSARIEARVESLRSWFASEFSLLDGETGKLLKQAPEHARMDWTVRAELAREVARRGQVEFIEEEEPWLLLALPVGDRSDERLVAVAGFLTRSPAGDEEHVRLGRILGAGKDEAVAWAQRQTPVNAEVLRRMADLAAAKMAADQEVEQLEGEVEKLSVHLGSTFEEISLLYRLTQNLKLSSNDEELGQRALEWLAEVVPAEGLALQFTPHADRDLITPDSRSEPVLLTYGECPLDVNGFSRIVSELGLNVSNRPLVVNRHDGDVSRWDAPEIRQLVIVPVAEGERLFGWLAAFNHTRNAEFGSAGEFGSAEASLLSSVGTMLGIHSGNIDLYRQQAELLAGVVRAMTSAIDAKDPYTRGHSDRVARVAVRLAQELGCDAETLHTIYFSGLLHDIGKIGINDEVLRKPGKLSDDEFQHIKMHVEIGYRILVDLRKMSHMLPVVLHHHESWDGTGYPHGLAGTEIPFLARIVAVADAYDAMASDRPYRAGMEDDKLDSIIRSGAGRQWDPDVVEAFFRARDDIRAISGRSSPEPELNEVNWS